VLDTKYGTTLAFYFVFVFVRSDCEVVEVSCCWAMLFVYLVS